MKTISITLAICLLAATVPVCRAQQTPAHPGAAAVSTPAATIPSAIASDTTARTDTLSARETPTAQPAAQKAYSRWWRRGMLGGAGIIALIALIIAVKNYHDR